LFEKEIAGCEFGFLKSPQKGPHISWTASGCFEDIIAQNPWFVYVFWIILD
jgi:hypothetical protein